MLSLVEAHAVVARQARGAVQWSPDHKRFAFLCAACGKGTYAGMVEGEITTHCGCRFEDACGDNHQPEDQPATSHNSAAPQSSPKAGAESAKQRSSQIRAALTADRAEILRAVKLIAQPGGVHEIRALNVKGAGATASGYFNSVKPLIDAVLRLDAEGIYITLNPTNPALLARSKNALKPYAKHTTSDTDILSRRWLPLDFDPGRPSGISSTDAEHEAAIERAKQAREFLTARGFPEPILADSGNGAHLLYRIAEPNDAETAALCKRVLEVLDSEFTDETVAVDRTNYNAARIFKLYGTPARKGDSTPDRPHRLARILQAPDEPGIVTREQLEQIAALLPEPEPRANTFQPRDPFNLENFIAQHGIPIKRHSTWSSGERWVLEHCVFDPNHTGSSAAILRMTSGAMVYRCLHNGCAGRAWRDVRQLYEPNYATPTPTQPGPERREIAARQPKGLRTVSEYLIEVGERARVKHYCDRFLRAGEIVLFLGRPFTGKSWLACACARCLVHTLAFLGRGCVKTKIAYFALERNGAKVARQLARWGLEKDILFTEQVPSEGTAEYIEREITRLGLEVVFIDHLQHVLRVEKSGEYGNVSNKLIPYQEIAKRTGCCIVFLHHQKKPQGDREDNSDVIDALGSEAFRAAADVLLETTKVGGEFFVRAQVRDEDDLPRTRILIDEETGDIEWANAHEADVLNAEEAIDKYLVAYSAAKAPTERDIRGAIKGRGKTASEALRAGVKATRFHRTGAGGRVDPYRYHLADGTSCVSCVSHPYIGSSGHAEKNERQPRENKEVFRVPQDRDTKAKNEGDREGSCPSVSQTTGHAEARDFPALFGQNGGSCPGTSGNTSQDTQDTRDTPDMNRDREEVE